jgi:hypothetical protein
MILLLPLCSHAQVLVVEDRANTGQLKRMVHEQWDDWQPDPGTNWLGLPRDLEGFLYWRVLHNRYYSGDDLRPFSTDGPFARQYASLSLQQQAGRDIRDSTEAIMQTQLSTHLQMSGSELDIAYRLYYGPKFDAIFSQLEQDPVHFLSKFPRAAQAMAGSRQFQLLTERKEILRDRIDQVHAAYMDKGKRIEAYMALHRELEQLQQRMGAWLSQQALLARFPTSGQQESIRKEIRTAYAPNDARIVKDILSKF